MIGTRLAGMVLAGTTCLSGSLVASAAALPAFVKDLNAGRIAVVSDGDFVAQSYATGQLAPAAAGYRDLLTVISLRDGEVTVSAVEVSNSVTAPPEVLELTRDGRTAFVVERLGRRAAGASMIRDLTPGRRLFAIDLSDKRAPTLTNTVDVAAFPEALSVSPDGRHVAVVANTAEASVLQIVSYRDGRFGRVATFPLAEHGIAGNGSGPRGGVTATNVDWHPSGRFLSVNLNTMNRVAFFEVAMKEGDVRVRRWGSLVETGTDPFVGRFTSDGRHYLTADWGRNFAATTLEGRLPAKRSSISVIRLADPDAVGTAAVHRRIGGTETDLSSEGLAVSPDGRLVATINMRGTAFPPDHSHFNREATVTLMTFDPDSGSLSKVADYPFEGVLPEGGSFDLTGDHLLVTIFQYHDGQPAGGGLEVFRVAKGGRPALERLGRVPLPHGTHHVDVAR